MSGNSIGRCPGCQQVAQIVDGQNCATCLANSIPPDAVGKAATDTNDDKPTTPGGGGMEAM